MRKNDNPKILHEKVGWELPPNLWTCRAYGHHGNQHRPWAPPWNTQLFRCLGALLLRTWSFHLIFCARRSSTSGPTTPGIYHSMMTLLCLQNKAEEKKHHCRQGQCGGNSAMMSFLGLKAPCKWQARCSRLWSPESFAIADSQTMAEAMGKGTGQEREKHRKLIIKHESDKRSWFMWTFAILSVLSLMPFILTSSCPRETAANKAKRSPRRERMRAGASWITLITAFLKRVNGYVF